MEKLHHFVTKERLLACVVGTPIDISCLSDEQIDRLTVCMLHCCLNGPVSVHKVTTFPGGWVTSIDEVLGKPTTNGSWRATCGPFAIWLKKHFANEVKRCQQCRIHKDLWPLWDGYIEG
jgi:hypothetical protein